MVYVFPLVLFNYFDFASTNEYTGCASDVEDNELKDRASKQSFVICSCGIGSLLHDK